jgi:hypothetical protein
LEEEDRKFGRTGKRKSLECGVWTVEESRELVSQRQDSREKMRKQEIKRRKKNKVIKTTTNKNKV